MRRPWFIPETFEQQNDLLRFQFDPAGETEFQRVYAVQSLPLRQLQEETKQVQSEYEYKTKEAEYGEKEKDFQRHKELLQMQHDHQMQVMQVTMKRKMNQFLIQSGWNQQSPADWKQAVAMVLNAIIVSKTRKSFCIEVKLGSRMKALNIDTRRIRTLRPLLCLHSDTISWSGLTVQITLTRLLLNLLMKYRN